jgi:hypothetical protein
MRKMYVSLYSPTYALDILQDSILGYEGMTVLHLCLDERESHSADEPSCPLRTAILAEALALDIVVRDLNEVVMG